MIGGVDMVEGRRGTRQLTICIKPGQEIYPSFI
jgi:hypothetical protein